MTSKESWRRYLEIGATVGELTIARAENIARGLTAEDEQVRKRAWREVDLLARLGVRMGEQLLDVAKDRLATELETRSGDTIDRVLERLGDLLSPAAADEAIGVADGSITAVETKSPASDGDAADHPSLERPALGEAADEQPHKTKKPAKTKGLKAKNDDGRVAARPTSSGADKQRRAKKTSTGAKAKKDKRRPQNAKEKEPAAAGPAPLHVVAAPKDPGSDALP